MSRLNTDITKQLLEEMDTLCYFKHYMESDTAYLIIGQLTEAIRSAVRTIDAYEGIVAKYEAEESLRAQEALLRAAGPSNAKN